MLAIRGDQQITAYLEAARLALPCDPNLPKRTDEGRAKI